MVAVGLATVEVLAMLVDAVVLLNATVVAAVVLLGAKLLMLEKMLLMLETTLLVPVIKVLVLETMPPVLVGLSEDTDPSLPSILVRSGSDS